jgi:glycosyltransferase involved in cell wall biosynthesis
MQGGLSVEKHLGSHGSSWLNRQQPAKKDRSGRPSVAIVAHDIHDAGGMERSLAELIRRVHMDWRVVVIASYLDPGLRPLVDWRRVWVPRRPMPLKFSLFFLLASLHVACMRVNIVHVTGAIVFNRADIATVHFCHAGFYEENGSFCPKGRRGLWRLNTIIARGLALTAERWCYRPSRLSVLCAVSSGVAAELARHYPAVPLRLTPNGVDIVQFAPDAAVRRRVRDESGVGPVELVVLFVGGDWDHKGLAAAIEGIGIACGQGASLKLWVVGRGQKSKFEELAKRAGVEGKVRFFGSRTNMASFYQGADMFVLPSLYETFSLAAHEAAACSLPIIATPVNGVKDLVGNNEAGILVERNREELGSAFYFLATDECARSVMGTEGRRRVAERTWTRSVESVLDVYKDVLSVDTSCVQT